MSITTDIPAAPANTGSPDAETQEEYFTFALNVCQRRSLAALKMRYPAAVVLSMKYLKGASADVLQRLLARMEESAVRRDGYLLIDDFDGPTKHHVICVVSDSTFQGLLNRRLAADKLA